jgi:hypothetical protein
LIASLIELTQLKSTYGNKIGMKLFVFLMFDAFYTSQFNMASQTKTKLYKVESKSAKTGVKAFVEDSLFPFKPGENLMVRIDKDRLIVTKLKD